MSATDSRLEQFRKMANDDPGNELGHFSLGRALLEAGEAQEALGAFDRVIAINPNISKVYQLKADAQIRVNQKDAAITTLQAGIKIANSRGDLMPKNEMLRMLKDLGGQAPELEQTSAPQQVVGEGQLLCHRCGRVMPRMASPPFSNAQGKLIQEKICTECWREWIAMGTKVINELRLPLADPQAQKAFDQHMMEFLNLT